MDRQKNLVEMPCITRPGALAPELMGVLLPKLPTPLPDSFVGHDDVPCQQQLFDITVAETEPEIQPHTRTDDLLRKTVVLVAVGVDVSMLQIWHTM
jgi:hypothetical protein